MLFSDESSQTLSKRANRTTKQRKHLKDGHRETQGQQNGHTLKSRRRFGPSAKAGPSSTAVRELLGSGACDKAVLSFPRETDVGGAKTGVRDADSSYVKGFF